MFGLLHNLYHYVKEKSERKITLVTLGLDNAGKTTLINTVQGLLKKDVSPTYGFASHSLTEGKFKVEVFDVGGGKNLRRLWKNYLAEVHAIVYVVDAADQARFEESKKSLEDMLAQAHLHDKPVLVFANKQDLPIAATAADVAVALGLTRQNRFNILGCVAKTPEGQQADVRLREGLKWVISQVNNVFTSLDVRVKQESAVVKEEEARKKKERDEQARRNREERQRQQEQEEKAAAQQQQEQHNALANLPNQIESPNFKPALASFVPPPPSPLGQFSDLQRPDQGHDFGANTIAPPRNSAGSMPLGQALALPPLSMHPSLAAHASSAARPHADAPSRRLSEAVSESVSARAPAATHEPPVAAPASSRPPSAPVKATASLDGESKDSSNSVGRLSNKVKPTTSSGALAAPSPQTPEPQAIAAQ